MAAARAVVTAIVAPAGTSAARTASATVAGLIVVAPGIAGATRSSQHFLAARTVKAVGTGAVRTRGAAASAVEALLARAIAIGSAATGALRTGGAVEALPARAAFIARTAVRAIAIGAAAATVATRLRVGSLLRAHAGLSCALASRRLGRGLESLVARAVLASRLGSASGRLSLGLGVFVERALGTRFSLSGVARGALIALLSRTTGGTPLALGLGARLRLGAATLLGFLASWLVGRNAIGVDGGWVSPNSRPSAS